MATTFRALTAADILNTGDIVRSSVDLDTYALLSTSRVGKTWDFSTVDQDLSSQHTRKVIRLCVPTFNFVLGRSGCTLLAKMLRVPASVWENIVALRVVLDKSTGELIPVDEAAVGGDYLYGAQIAEKMIADLDLEEAKLDCLYSGFKNCLSSNANPRDFITIDKNSNGMQLVAGYYAHFEDNVMCDNLKRGFNFEDVQQSFIDTIFPNGDSRLSYLLNMKQDKSGLYGMLNYYIVVVPEEMRPKIDDREHKLTKRYVSVLKANHEMQITYSDNPVVIAAKYLSLERAVEKLQYKNQGMSQNTKPDDLAVMERIKSKKGQIRMRNLGKRQDYSGRAVVCINPFLPLDTIRVPKSMLPKLLEYHVLPFLADNMRRNLYDIKTNNYISNLYDTLRLSNLDSPEAREEVIRIIEEEKLLDRIPVALGRQPTLHRQSYLAFHVEMTDLHAIEVSPLVCVGFNMDFDGDQAHLEVPLSDAAIREFNDLLMVTQNLFLSKNGDCVAEPRMDMLYGLWMCTRDTYVLGAEKVSEPFETMEDVRQAVMFHRVKVWQTVYVLSERSEFIAGDAAFIACFPKGDILPRGSRSSDGTPCVMQIDKKTITPYINHLLRIDSFGNFVHKIGVKYDSTETVVGTLRALSELGFRAAKIYPPNMSLIVPDNPIPEYDNAVDNFYSTMENIDMLYDLGFETSDNYKIEFDRNLGELNSIKSKYLLNKLGEDNGYVRMSVSGARGSKDNLLQAFSIKGQVKKNSTESFDALLESSYAGQLTPMEHSVDAYGGRQGQIDKSLKTGDTGYASRLMWHASQGTVITTKDCGTNDGIDISKSYLSLFVDADLSVSEQQSEIATIFAHILEGRYRVGSNKVITANEAKEWANNPDIHSIKIRSPITCKNPCCQKCYGIDWSTRKPAVIGLPAGIIAAQSIGEPISQLTLKEFQKGGVAGKAEVSSAFDRSSKYLHIADLARLSKEGKYSGYDPVAWDTGKVVTRTATDINSKLVYIGDNKSKKLLVPKESVLKEYVTQGEGMSYKHGDFNIAEVMVYSGITTAQMYLMLKLFAIFRSEVTLKTVHFEVLVASMTRYMILETDRKDIMVGQYCTAQELLRGSVVNTRYIPRIIGVKKLNNASNSALDAIMMESQVEGLSRICLLNMSDDLDKPINGLVMGKTITCGSKVPGFVDCRKEQ